MVLLTIPQTLYISITVVALLLLLLFTALYIYKNVYSKKHFKEATFILLSRLAKYNDYLLLNNFRLDYDDKHFGYIDHILISNKYIFVINDFSISGVINGDQREDRLRLVNLKGGAKIISNPINYNINLIKKLNTMSRIDQTFVKGVVVVNNDARINITNKNDQFMIVRRKDIGKLIAKYDKDPVNNLKENETINFINKLNRINQKRSI